MEKIFSIMNHDKYVLPTLNEICYSFRRRLKGRPDQKVAFTADIKNTTWGSAVTKDRTANVFPTYCMLYYVLLSLNAQNPEKGYCLNNEQL